MSNSIKECSEIKAKKVSIDEKNNKESENGIAANKTCNISIPEIRIDKIEEPEVLVDEVYVLEDENESGRNQICVITQPEIKIDLVETNLYEDNPEDDEKKEAENQLKEKKE